MVETLSKKKTKVHNWRTREEIQAFRLLFPLTRKSKLTVPPNPVSPIVPIFAEMLVIILSKKTLRPPLNLSPLGVKRRMTYLGDKHSPSRPPLPSVSISDLVPAQTRYSPSCSFHTASRPPSCPKHSARHPPGPL